MRTALAWVVSGYSDGDGLGRPDHPVECRNRDSDLALLTRQVSGAARAGDVDNAYRLGEQSNRRGLAWIERNLAPLLTGPTTAAAGPVIVHTLA
jgi:hypothetical protein